MRNYKSQTECRADINRLSAPFLAIYESLIPSEEEKEKQKQLMALLNKHVTREWPGARLFLYGSCANSFGFRKSDIDVCLALGDADIDKSEILLKLADILKSDNLENVQVQYFSPSNSFKVLHWSVHVNNCIKFMLKPQVGDTSIIYV